VYKIAANATQFAECILLHAYSRTTASYQLHEYKQTSIAYLSSWQKSIFGCKLSIDYEQLRLKILQKLRTGSLNSEFTGSYKKSTT